MAALGLTRVQVNNGSLTIGANTGGNADPTKPATVVLTLGVSSSLSAGSNNRVSLSQLVANAAGTTADTLYTGTQPSAGAVTRLGGVTFTGLIQANLPLTGAGGATAPLGISWDLSSAPSYNNPNASPNPAISGGTQTTALIVSTGSALTAAALDATGAAGLQQATVWASAIGTAAGQTPTLATPLPVLGESLTQLTQLPAVLTGIGNAVQAYATAGNNTAGFYQAISTALATFNAGHPGFTLTANPAQTYAGLIPAANATLAQSLGLQAGYDQLLFNLVLTATYAGTQAISLGGGDANDNIAFQGNVPYTATVQLGVTFVVSLQPNLGPQDATSVELNQLDATVSVAATGLSFPVSIGVLGAQVTGGKLNMTAEAGLLIQGGGIQPLSISNIAGTSPTGLLNVVPRTSTLSATLPLTATFGDLASDTAAITITANPLTFAGPSVSITGPNATTYNAFANLTPAQLLSALKSVGSAITAANGSSLLSAPVPLTTLTIGQAADFASEYASDVTAKLTGNGGAPVFSTIQQFAQDITALTGVTGVTATYTSYNNQLAIGFNLAETFATTPSLFNYDLTAAAGSALANLTHVGSTGTLAVGGTGTVGVGFNFNLAPTAITLHGGMELPANGVLPAGTDAHFNLALSVDGASPTVVPVTVSAAATQANTTIAQLVAEVNTALQQALTAAGLAANQVAASTTSGAGGIVLLLTLTSGTYTTLQVTTPPGDPAAWGLGLTPSQTQTATITGTNAVPANGKLTADASFTVTADGGTPTMITITAASTAGNSSQNQLLTQVQAALAPLNATLATAGRLPVVISLTSAGHLQFAISGYGSTLQIAAGTEAQIGLGLAPTQSVEAGAPIVSVQGSAGAVSANYILPTDQTFSIAVDGRSTFNITVTAASTAGNTAANAKAASNTPPQMLADEITTALAPVNADLAAAGLPGLLVQIDSTTNQLKFVTSGAKSTIEIKAAPGNLLGIGTDDVSTAPVLTTIGSQNFGNQVNLTKLSLGGTVAVTGPITGNADFGLVALDINQPNVAINGTVGVSLYNQVSLASLLANAGTLSNYFYTPTETGAASLTLPVSASGPFGAALGLDGTAAVTLNAANLFQLNGWTLDTSHLESVTNLGSLSFAQVKSAITQLGSAIAANGLLNEQIPLINQSLGSLLGITQDFNAIANDLALVPNFTLDQLQSRARAARSPRPSACRLATTSPSPSPTTSSSSR